MSGCPALGNIRTGQIHHGVKPWRKVPQRAASRTALKQLKDTFRISAGHTNAVAPDQQGVDQCRPDKPCATSDDDVHTLPLFSDMVYQLHGKQET
jgi:hypothetical protein